MYLWGRTFMALDTGGFMPVQAFKERTDDLIQYIKSYARAWKEVLTPFEREWRTREKRLKEGILVDDMF